MGFDEWTDSTEEIKESSFSIVVLSMDYASSKERLRELVVIMDCKANRGQTVMPVFYEVNPSDVEKQIGYFWKAFDTACLGIPTDETIRWGQALEDVSQIPRKYFIDRDAESELTDISRDISKEINTRICSTYFRDVVGLETHLEKIQPLLHLHDGGNKEIVGIWGPAGIGKTTIVSALRTRFSSSFQHSCVVNNVRRSFNSGLDDYASKLDATRESLSDQKVLIILDDVEDLKQLGAWVSEINKFGPGSRIVMTTEDQELLENDSINGTYQVVLPSNDEALQIFCQHAFGQRSPRDGFAEVAKIVVGLCGNLPSRLREMGRDLGERSKGEWEKEIGRVALSDNRKKISIGMAFLVIISLVLEITSAVVEHLASNPYLAIISLVISFLSFVLSGLDLIFNIRDHKACFRCKWRPIPWFYYPAPGYNRSLGNITDNVLLFCAVVGLIVSTVNFPFIVKGREGPIKAVVVWPLSFAFGKAGLVAYKFIQERQAISKYNYLLKKIA